MDISFIKGIVPPIITPFDENEKIDEQLFRNQIEFLINQEVNGILVFGSNGEFYNIEEDEYERGLKIAIDQVNHRIPLYCGIGAISTKKCIRLAKMAKECGANAISVLQPMFLKPSQTELYNHFKAIAESIAPMPMLLYNNPGRTAYSLTKELVSTLAHEVENIVGIKDSSGDITLLEEIVRLTRDLDFHVFGGKDTLIYGALMHGAVGAVTSTSNYVPKLVKKIYDSFIAGDYKASFEAQLLLNPIRILTDKVTFPIGTKDIVKLENGFCGNASLPVSFTTDSKILADMQSEIDKLDKLGLVK